MTAELKEGIQIMCNWSESIRERARLEARIEVIERMIRANITKEQILWDIQKMNMKKQRVYYM